MPYRKGRVKQIEWQIEECGKEVNVLSWVWIYYIKLPSPFFKS
jgi:hypothetical protein